MVFDQQLPQLLNVGRPTSRQQIKLRLPPVLDDFHEPQFFKLSLFLPAVAGSSRLTAEVITNCALADMQLPSDGTFGLAFVMQYLKCHDFILCQFRQLHLLQGFFKSLKMGRAGDFGNQVAAGDPIRKVCQESKRVRLRVR